MSDTDYISLKILDKPHSFKCDPKYHQSLKDALADLEKRIEVIKRNSALADTSQILGIVALNLAHELMLEKQNTPRQQEIMQNCIDALDKALSKRQAFDYNVLVSDQDL